MAGFSDAYESAILNLLLAGKAIANIADNASVSPTTALWVSLHSGDPGDTGTQATNEISLTGYTRIATSRSTGSGGWNVSTSVGSASPNANIDFPLLTSTSTATATYAAIGLSSAGAGTLIASGALSASINLGLNVIPRLTTASSFTLD